MYSKGRKLGMNIAGKFKKKLGDSDDKEQQGMPLHDVSSDSALGLKAESIGQNLSKSSSMGSIHNDSTVSDRTIVNQDDINILTQGVKSFSDGLARLKAVFGECTDSKEELRVQTHERLGEVLFTLKNILHNYPALQSTELFSASGALIFKVKNYDYAGTSTAAAEQNFAEAIDQLALAFSSSVSEYLMGDIDSSFTEKDVKTKSCDNLLGSVNDKESNVKEELSKQEVTLTPEDIDSLLCKLQAGVDLALQRAKAWSKYMKDITSYIEKKAQLETEYSKNLARLAMSMKPVLTEEGFLPLQSVYCTVLSQDKDYASTCQATQTLLQASKFVEPLMARRLEHDKMRKNIKDSWSKELKKMQDAVHSLRKAQSLYVTRQQEYEKAKEQAKKMESDMLSQSSSSSALNKVDKRRKMEEEALHKAAEAETTYKACVAEANCRQQELGKTKTELLARIREQIYQCDQVIKAVTIEYFHLLHTVTTPIPIQYHTLSETTKKYDPGVQYREFVRRLPINESKQTNTEPFVFESYVSTSAKESNERKTSTQSTGSASSGPHSQEGSPQPTSPWKERHRIPVTAWSQGVVVGSDTDSASGSSKSLESSPNNSPHPTGHRRLMQSGSLDDLDEVSDLDKQRLIHQGLLPVPGTDIGDGLCIIKFQGDRRNTTFGVDFQEQIEHCHSAVPPIVIKCLQEIEKRGITFEGIYRKSGVKSKVEGLCRKFEKDPDSVDLDEEPPHVISNVLKLYLRQLPEPLFTFKLYSGFIKAAKDITSGNSEKQETINTLSDIVSKLPYSNMKTCATLLHHLHRIASYCSINQMTAHNLGIIFGPTLLRPLEGTSSLASLVDMPYQTKAVELLITFVQDVFGPESEFELIPGETPVEKLANDDKPSKKQHLAPMPPSQSSPPSNAKSSAEKKSQPQEQKIDSTSPPEKIVDQLIKGDQDDAEPKNSVADFVLPGSAHCDKKDSNSPTVTISDGEDTGDTQSDDDLPDTLLPDDSVSVQQSPTMYCHQEGRGAIARTLHNNKSVTNQSCERDPAQGKPSPPQQLRLTASKVMSPDTTRKIKVPTINIIDSSPVGDNSLQTGLSLSREQSKKLNQSWPSQSSKKPKQGKSSSDSGISIKSVGPSIQSFIVSTAKSIFSDGTKHGSSKLPNVTNESGNVIDEVSSNKQNKDLSLNKNSEVQLPTSQAPMSSFFPRKNEIPEANTPTPPTFSPQLSRQTAKTSKEKPAVAPKPTPESRAAANAKDETKSSFPSPSLTRLVSTAKPDNVGSSSPILTKYTPIRTDESFPKPPIKTRSSPQLMRQAPVTDDGTMRYSYTSFSDAKLSDQGSVSPRYSFTPHSAHFSPKPLRHATSLQSSLPSGYGLHKTSPSPTLSRKSLSLTDHSAGKSGRISPRPLSSPLVLRQSSTSPTFRSSQRDSDSSYSSSDPLVSSGEHQEVSRSSSQSSSDHPEFSMGSLIEDKSEDLTALYKTGMESRNRRSLCSLDKEDDETLTQLLTLSQKSSKHDNGKLVSEASINNQPLKRPKLPSFESSEGSYSGTRDSTECKQNRQNLTDVIHKDELKNTATNGNEPSKNHSNLKLSPREKFLLGIAETEHTKTVKSVSFDLDSFQGKDEAEEKLDNPSVVLKIIEDNFSGKGNLEKSEDEENPPDLSIVSGYVYDVSPRILTSRHHLQYTGSLPKNESSLSSQSSMSDIEDSSVTSSDVSPELSRSLVSLPKSNKFALMSSSCFPDFSPILPRQKDSVLKKHNSLPNLPPSSTFPLSGNLSSMASISAEIPNDNVQRAPGDQMTDISGHITRTQAKLSSHDPSVANNTAHEAKYTKDVSVSPPSISQSKLSPLPSVLKTTTDQLMPISSISRIQTTDENSCHTPITSAVISEDKFEKQSLQQDESRTQTSAIKEHLSPKMTRSKPYSDLHIYTKPIQVTGSLAKIISPLIAQASNTLHSSQPSVLVSVKQKTPPPSDPPTKDIQSSPSQPLQSRIPVSPKVKRSGCLPITSSHPTSNVASAQTVEASQSVHSSEKQQLQSSALKNTQTNTNVKEQSLEESLKSTPNVMLASSEQITDPEPQPEPVTLLSTQHLITGLPPSNQTCSQRPQPIGGECETPISYQSEQNMVATLSTDVVSGQFDQISGFKSEESNQSATEQVTSLQLDTVTTKLDSLSTQSAPSSNVATKIAPKDTKPRPGRTTVQTTKSTVAREPSKTVKGPSGIVMGKSAIMPGRGNRATSTVGGRKSPAVGGHVSSGRKSPSVANSSAVGGRKSPAVGSSTATVVRRQSAGAVGLSGGRKSPSVGHSSFTTTGGRKSGAVCTVSSGRKSPAVSSQHRTCALSHASGSPVGQSSHARKSSVPSSTPSSSSPKSSVSCSTCGRRKTSVGRTSSEHTQQVTLTSYKRTSTTPPVGDSIQSQGSSNDGNKLHETKDSEIQSSKKKVPEKGQKIIVRSSGTSAKKERVPYFV